ncbi:MAG: hypothetical protein PVG79_09260 [Gemmatimonadales bacterium]|jgi:hypothetical protein
MRRSTVILLSALVGLALLTPVQDAVAQQGRGNGNSAVTYQITNPRMFTVAACGEAIEITGVVEIKQVAIAQGRNDASEAWHVLGKGTGVSYTSGSEYVWRQTLLQRITGDAWGDGQYSSHTHQRTRLVGKGDAPNITFELHMHFTRNANGDFAADFYVSDASCNMH